MKKSELILLIREEIQNYFKIREVELLEAETKILINELNFDLNNHYELDLNNNSSLMKSFKDDYDRLNIIKAKNNNDWTEIKFYWLKDDGKGGLIPTYEAPPNPTEKTLNTYFYILFTYFLSLNNKFIFQPIDKVRQRLYMIILNKFLDKNQWALNELDDKILLIKKGD